MARPYSDDLRECEIASNCDPTPNVAYRIDLAIESWKCRGQFSRPIVTPSAAIFVSKLNALRHLHGGSQLDAISQGILAHGAQGAAATPATCLTLKLLPCLEHRALRRPDDIMAQIAAAHVAQCLAQSGFVVMPKPPGSQPRGVGGGYAPDKVGDLRAPPPR